MSKIKWYKRDPLAALEGMMMLTLEERGAYNTVLDLIYTRTGSVPDDDRFLAGWMQCDVRVWKRIRSRLITLGKLQVNDGMLRNARATYEIDEALHRCLQAAEAGRTSAAKRASSLKEINDLGSTVVQRTLQPTTTTTTISKKDRENGNGLSGKVHSTVSPPGPRHGATGRGFTYLKTGTSEWEAYAADFQEVTGFEPVPDLHGGKWFKTVGEHH